MANVECQFGHDNNIIGVCINDYCQRPDIEEILCCEQCFIEGHKEHQKDFRSFKQLDIWKQQIVENRILQLCFDTFPEIKQALESILNNNLSSEIKKANDLVSLSKNLIKLHKFQENLLKSIEEQKQSKSILFSKTLKGKDVVIDQTQKKLNLQEENQFVVLEPTIQKNQIQKFRCKLWHKTFGINCYHPKGHTWIGVGSLEYMKSQNFIMDTSKSGHQLFMVQDQGKILRPKGIEDSEFVYQHSNILKVEVYENQLVLKNETTEQEKSIKIDVYDDLYFCIYSLTYGVELLEN